MRKRVVVRHLELLDASTWRPSSERGGAVDLRRVEPPQAEVNSMFYAEVGRKWHWVDRLGWTRSDWQAYLDRGELETWVARCDGRQAGYFEMEIQPEDSAEIAYLGVLPEFIGRGVGGRLLTGAVERAWQRGARRVWVHTCSLDHPRALGFYQAHGFREFKVEERFIDWPDSPPRLRSSSGEAPGS